MYFLRYRLRKTWLHKCLKSRVLEGSYTENMGDWSKQYSSLNDSIFTKFINQSEGSSIRKSVF